MAAFDDIKSGLDINEVAAMLGTDPASASQAVDQALSSLLGAFEGNVSDPDGAFGLARAALSDHGNDLLEGGVNLGAVDTADGEAILGHVYSPQQIQALRSGSGGGGLIDRLLPILAPLVMAYIAKKLNGAISDSVGRRNAPPEPQQQGGGGGVLGDLLDSVLGGGQQAQAPSRGGSGDILGDLLGSIFGQEAPRQAPVPQPPTPAPRIPGADGPFASPSGGVGDLRMDDGSNDPSGPPSHPAQPSAGPAAGGLGDLLRQILVGR